MTSGYVLLLAWCIVCAIYFAMMFIVSRYTIDDSWSAQGKALNAYWPFHRSAFSRQGKNLCNIGVILIVLQIVLAIATISAFA